MSSVLKNIGEVDGLKITVLMDDYAGFDNPYLAQHGLSLFIEVQNSGKVKNILLDTGQTSETVLHNMDLLGISPQSIDLVFISHCHYDHTGGLEGILKEIGHNTCIIAHPDLFRENYSLKNSLKNIGITTDEKKILQRKGLPVLVREPFEITAGIISTGEVERVTDFEGKGIGTYNLVDGRFVPDQIFDDMSLAVNIKGKGLFIIAGCSHSGIINIVKHSVNITGVKKVYGIMGGLHLLDASKEKILRTIEELSEFNLEIISAGHCTGLEALAELSKEFGDRFIHFKVGTEIQI
ncbi:MAG: MBL fold metallo-hydrolase [Firmicutes bacterium]|nr:MBL fold metallo-hydrolase [Bacillota bacterium]